MSPHATHHRRLRITAPSSGSPLNSSNLHPSSQHCRNRVKRRVSIAYCPVQSQGPLASPDKSVTANNAGITCYYLKPTAYPAPPGCVKTRFYAIPADVSGVVGRIRRKACKLLVFLPSMFVYGFSTFVDNSVVFPWADAFSGHPEVGGNSPTLHFPVFFPPPPRQNWPLSEARPRGCRRLPITLNSVTFRAVFFQTDTCSSNFVNFWFFFPLVPPKATMTTPIYGDFSRR